MRKERLRVPWAEKDLCSASPANAEGVHRAKKHPETDEDSGCAISGAGAGDQAAAAALARAVAGGGFDPGRDAQEAYSSQAPCRWAVDCRKTDGTVKSS